MKKHITIFSLFLIICCIAFLFATSSPISADTVSENVLSAEKEKNNDANVSMTNNNPLTERASIQTYALTGIMKFPGVTTDYTKPLDAKYSFFPRMNWNSKWYREKDNTPLVLSDSAIAALGKKVIKIDTIDSPGTVRVTNVGMYNGVTLDLLVEFTYLKKIDDKPLFGNKTIANVEIGADPSIFLNMYMSGKKDTEVNVRLTTVAHGTKNKVKTSGVVTYNQITDVKMLLLQQSQVTRLFTPKDSIVQYNPTPGTTINAGQAAYGFQASTQSDEATNRLVQQYDDLTERAVGIKMLQTSAAVSQKLNSPPPLLITPVAPSIIGDNTIKKPAENSTYKLTQLIPPQPGKQLNNFEMMVLLEPVFQDVAPQDVMIKDQNNEIIGEDKLNKEIIKGEDGRQVLYISATKDYLNSNLSDGSGLYANEFEMTIPVKIDYSKDYTQYLVDAPEGSYGKLIEAKATAQLIIDGFENQLENWTVESSPVRFKERVADTIEMRNENNELLFERGIEQKVGAPYEFTKEMFEDDLLEMGLSIVSISSNAKGTQTPEEITIVITVEDRRFNSEILIYRNGNLVNDDKLRYGDKVTVNYHISYTGQYEGSFQKDSTIVAGLPVVLPNALAGPPTNMELVDGEGNSVGQVSYEENNVPGQLIGKINNGTPIGTDIYLKYDATISKNITANSQINFPATVNASEGFLYEGFTKTFSKKMTIIPNTATVTVNFLDEKGNSLHKAETLTEDVGTSIDLTRIQTITDILADLQKNHYALVKCPDPEQFTVAAEGNNVTYQFSGTLSLVSAPTTFDFETKKATINAVKYTSPVIEQPLVVSDTRADGGKWVLKARVDQPLTGPANEGQPMIIPDAIKYKSADDELTLSDQDAVIFNYMDGRGSYNVTQERWTKGDGFMIDLKPGAIKALGKYQAKITMTLENAK